MIRNLGKMLKGIHQMQSHSSDLRLLSAVEVGKLLFGSSLHSDAALLKRVLRLKDKENLPMTKLQGKWIISASKLKQWQERL